MVKEAPPSEPDPSPPRAGEPGGEPNARRPGKAKDDDRNLKEGDIILEVTS